MEKSRVLFSLLIMLGISINTYAQFSGSGSGAEEDPYQISSPSQFDEIRNFLGNENEEVYFVLINDIDFSDWLIENNSENGWVPIGTDTQAFKGNLDGANFTISGVWAERENYVGVFGYIHSGKIKNLNIELEEEKGFIGNDYVGILSASISEADITNVQVNGKLSGNNYIGGLAGLVFEGSTLINNSAIVNINAQGNNIGGLIGENHSPLFHNSSSGRIDSYGDSIGGLVGISWEEVINCTSSVDITNLGGDLFGNFVGGLVGINGHSISESSATGKIIATNIVGGLVGDSSGASISNSFATGEVIGSSVIGGLVGTSGQVTNSYATGIVNGTMDKVGGLIGLGAGPVNKCYALGDVFGAQAVGGLIGYSFGNVTQSFAKGDVSCVVPEGEQPDGGLIDIGGLIGNAFGLVENTYATGTVKAPENSMFIGGLLGVSANVNNSYASGRIETEAFSLVGGLIGESWGVVTNSVAANPSITSLGTNNVNRLFGNNAQFSTNCYAFENMYINGQNDLEGTAEDLNGEGKSIEDLQTQFHYNTTIGWDFDGIWTIREGYGYPYFGWHEHLTNIIISNVNDPNKGNIDPIGITIVEEGQNANFSITAAEGFEIESVFIDNVDVGILEMYTFSNVNENHTIEAVFKEKIILGLDNQNLSKTVYYPNPVLDFLNINSQETILKVEIYDLTGKLVHVEKLGAKNIQMNLDSINSGLYLIKVFFEKGTEMLKIIKK